MGNIFLSIALSSHLGMTGEFNNFHPRLTYVTEDNIISGLFYNSESQISLFAGKIYHNGDFSVETGIVTGYSGIKAAPMAKLNYNKFFVAPGYSTGGTGLIVGYEVKF